MKKKKKTLNDNEEGGEGKQEQGALTWVFLYLWPKKYFGKRSFDL